MADAGAIKAGEAFVSITASDAQMKRDLPAIQARWAGFVGAIQTAGAALSLGFLTRAASGAVESAGLRGREIFERAQAADRPVEQFARMAAAADAANISLDTLRVGLDNLARVGDVRQIDRIAARINAIEDAGERAAAVARTFGARADFGAFLSALEQTGDGGALAQQAAQANAVAQAFDRVRYAFSSVGTAFGAAISPVVSPMLGFLTGAATATRRFLAENQPLAQTLTVVGVGVGTVAAGLLGLAAAGLVAKGVAAGLTVATTGLSIAMTALAAVATSPLALILAGAVAAGAAFATMTETGRAAASSLGSLFGDLGRTFRETWGGILDAMKGGDLGLAMRIAVAGLKVAWLDFEVWFVGTFPRITQAFRALTTAIVGMWTGAQRMIASAWAHVVELFGGPSAAEVMAEYDAEARRVERAAAFSTADPRAELARLRAEASRLAAEAAQAASTQTGPAQQQGIIARGLFAAQAAFGLIGGSPTDRTEGYQRTMVAELQGIHRELQNRPALAFA